MHTQCMRDSGTGMRDASCTGHGLGPRSAGRQGSGSLGSRGGEATEGRRRGRQPASALTREGGAPGRPLGRPHARCQLHAGRCPDAFASPCALPACPRATARPRAAAGMGRRSSGMLARTRELLPAPIALPACSGTRHPTAAPLQGSTRGPTAARVPDPAAPASGTGFSARARPRNPTAALKYSGGKSPTVPCVAFYLNNILSWMTSLCNVV